MKLEYINDRGDILNLTGNSRFKLTRADGIADGSTEIYTTTNPTIDGDIPNAVRVIPRDITLDIVIESDVESVKDYIRKFVKLGQSATLRKTQNERTLQISGIVSDMIMPRNTNPVTMQLGLHCSQPFWEDTENSATEIAEVVPLFYFAADEDLRFDEPEQAFGEIDTNRTKVITNEGDAEIGLEIHLTALDTVKNPIIYNAAGEYLGVDITLEGGDEVVITTGKGNKKILKNNENITSKFKEGSKWLQLETGENEFTIDSEDGTEGDMYFTIIYRQRYWA